MMNQTSVGSIEGIPFTACTSGPDIIILASNFSRVQQITTKSNIKSIDCSTDVGRIAVSHDYSIDIYEPIPLQQQELQEQEQHQKHQNKQIEQQQQPQRLQQLSDLPTNSRLDYKWVLADTIEISSSISVLSFHLDGTRLIAGGQHLYLWSQENNSTITNTTTTNDDDDHDHNSTCKQHRWTCIWQYKSASQISYLKFSPDGTLFCSSSKHDRLVKIWFQRNKSFSFIYLTHPAPIIGFEWRRTSKYITKGSVANVLMTSCEDNISRIWVQDLYNYAQLYYGNCISQQQQQKLKQTRQMLLHFHLAGVIESSNIYNSQKSVNHNSHLPSNDTTNQASNDEKQSQFIVHWINNKEIHITRSIESYLHDTLLRIYRANQSSSTNSPLSPGESCSGSEIDTENEPESENGNDDTITAESSKKLRHKLCSKVNKQRALAASGRLVVKSEDNNSHRSLLGPNNNQQLHNGVMNQNGRSTPCSLADEFDKFVELQLKKWQSTSDVLYSLDKTNGSIQLWQIKYLDGEDTGLYRHVQIDKIPGLDSALSHYDATTMSLNVLAYSPSAYSNVKQAYLAIHNCQTTTPDQLLSNIDLPEVLSINTDTTSLTRQADGSNIMNVDNIDECLNANIERDPDIFFVTEHFSGILGLWKMNYDSSVPKIQSIELITRITGLPIDPEWLQDGILTVEYNERLAALFTQWIENAGSESVIDNVHNPRPISPTCHNQLFNLDFSTAHSVMNSHLPSVDEEKPGDHTPMIGDEVSNNDEIANTTGDSLNNSACKDQFRASEMAANINLLPQYHVKQLVELLAFGKLQRVKAILNNVVNCLLALESHNDKDAELTSHAPWSHRSRTLSIVGQTPSSINDSFDIDNPGSNIQQQVVEEVELDYIEVTSIKPLPLYDLIEADSEKQKKEIETAVSKTNKREEFSMQDFESFFPQRTQVDETLDEILGRTTLDTLNRQKSLKRKKEAALDGSLSSFNPSKAKLLTRVLTHTHLPGLSNVDQMHLLAVADAIALFDASASDYEDMQEEDGGYGSHSESGMGVVTTNIAIDSLDDRGLRFLTAMRQHVYLSRCLPIKQRAELQASGIGNHNLVWAFHSETQDELVSLIPCVNRNKPQWAELREYGIGWWLKKIEVLKKLIEKVAQSAYQARQDPLDAALFYFAMKKKTLVCALLRRVNCDKRLLKLFEQDFNDPVNRKKALKNAYALLGLHRFEHAAAFFILAGSIWDAVEVCINNLNDIQLAIVLIRLYDTESNVPPNLKKLLFTEILGSKRPTEPSLSNSTSSTSNNLNNSDTISSSAKNILERRSSIIAGTLNGFGGQQQGQAPAQPQYHYDSSRANPDPFLRSMAFWKLSDYLSAVHTLLENDVGTSCLQHDFSISGSVFNFYLYLKEQPLVIKHKQQLIEEAELRRQSSPIEEEEVHSHRARSLSSGELTFDEQALTKAVRQSSTEFEVLNETIIRQVDKYSDEAIARKERLLFFSSAYTYLKAGCPLLALEVLCKEDHLNISNAQRMKFIACLHILMNELNTVAAPTFQDWLIKNVEAMKSICAYQGTSEGDWVKQNEPLLRTMLTYCNLHSANENSLTIVRLELLSLLKGLG